ncbi:aspartate--tRNA ligase 2, cytoplasmic-like, partial [Rhododendron vialii]|uniref:aspartate--tRNA ligase 2, cytoplasmic-like n=1 Tax=Rhododendron vialii TaxID=182163 RepID=UPI00265E73A9
GPDALFDIQAVLAICVRIHTPKLIVGSCEGGSAVFRLDYKGQPACLAQSPQLHKQMAICGGFGRVFEVGSVFRAEDSFTHRHLCEFTGLDVEMEIKEHYSEVMDIVDRLFVELFDSLNERCQKELEAVREQHPFEPLKEVGTKIDPLGDLNA